LLFPYIRAEAAVLKLSRIKSGLTAAAAAAAAVFLRLFFP
jgi:hypothetical protein